MKRLILVLVCVLSFALAPAAWASSDDGFMVRAGDALIELRISIGDPNYSALFSGIARSDNLLFTMMSWAKARDSGPEKGPRALTVHLQSVKGADRSDRITVTLVENERIETHAYPHPLSEYDEDFFVNLLDRWFDIKAEQKLSDNVSLIVLRPAAGKSFPTIGYPYMDVYQGPVPGSASLDQDGRAFLAFFHYKNLDRYLSDHLNGEFIVGKKNINRSSVRKLFR